MDKREAKKQRRTGCISEPFEVLLPVLVPDMKRCGTQRKALAKLMSVSPTPFSVQHIGFKRMSLIDRPASPELKETIGGELRVYRASIRLL